MEGVMTRAAGLAVLEEVALLGPLRREMAACAAPDLQQGTGAVLWYLTQAAPTRMKDVAAALHVDLSGVSRAVADLVAHGHVERVADPDDRRACLLSPTPAGRAAVDAVVARLGERFAARFAGTDPADLQRLAEDLRHVRESWLPSTSRPTSTSPETSA
jgi:DNA-binding MarR family transcriptional regulator